MNGDGGDIRRITRNPAVDYFPCWSPNGSRMAFVSNRDGNHDIYSLDVEGGNIIRLTTDPAEDTTPSWR